MDLFGQRLTLTHDTASDALHAAHLNAGLLNALRETQVEHGMRLERLEVGISELKGDVSELRGGQGAIVGMLEELIRRDDERRTDPGGVSD
jgi:hypothetical protein